MGNIRFRLDAGTKLLNSVSLSMGEGDTRIFFEHYTH